MQDEHESQEVSGEPTMGPTVEVPTVEPLSSRPASPQPTITPSHAVDLAAVEQMPVESPDPIEQQITALNAAPDPTVRNVTPVLVSDVHAHIEPLKGSRRTPLIIGLVIGIIVLLGVAGAFYYWNVVRISDGSYQQAIAAIDQ